MSLVAWGVAAALANFVIMVCLLFMRGGQWMRSREVEPEELDRRIKKHDDDIVLLRSRSHDANDKHQVLLGKVGILEERVDNSLTEINRRLIDIEHMIRNPPFPYRPGLYGSQPQ